MLQHAKQGNLRFLVPLDGSQLAASVLPVVEQIASRFHAQVTLLHILEQHPPTTIHGEQHLSDAAEARAYLEEIATRLRSSAIAVEIHVHQDKGSNVARSIFQHAQEMNSDLVIMCTHGHGGLRGFLLAAMHSKRFSRARNQSCYCFQEKMILYALSISNASSSRSMEQLLTSPHFLLPSR